MIGEMAAVNAWPPPDAAELDALLEEAHVRTPHAPLILVLFIGLFAATVVLLGTNQSLYRIPYYLGVMSALFSVLVYFQYSLPIPTPVFLYIGWVVWSLLTALNAEMLEAVKFALQTVLQIMVMFAVFATVCQDGRAVWIIGIALVVGAVGVFFSALVMGVDITTERSAGLGKNPNATALLYDTGICVLLAALPGSRTTGLRVLICGVILVLLYGVVATGSRAGAIAAVAPVVYMGWSYRRSITRRPLLLMGIICVAVVAGVFLPGWLSRTELGHRWTAAMETVTGQASKEEGSTRARINLKFQALAVTMEHPIFGVGIGNFTPYVFRKQGETLSTHDTYLEVLSGTGFPGFFLYFSIYVWLWWMSGRMRKTGLVTPNELGLLALTRTFLVCRGLWDLFDNTGWTFKPAWMLMAVLSGFLTGLRQRVAQRRALALEFAGAQAPPVHPA